MLPSPEWIKTGEKHDLVVSFLMKRASKTNRLFLFPRWKRMIWTSKIIIGFCFDFALDEGGPKGLLLATSLDGKLIGPTTKIGHKIQFACIYMVAMYKYSLLPVFYARRSHQQRPTYERDGNEISIWVARETVRGVSLPENRSGFCV